MCELGNGHGNGNGNGHGQLTGLQRAFIEEWFKDFNGTQAARRAGYSGDENALAVRASELLRNRKVAAEIEKRWAARGMSAEEVMARLADQARANIGDFIQEEPAGALDLQAIKKRGHVVKKIAWTANGPSIEMYDGQAALGIIAKHLGLLTERVDITSGGKELLPIAELVAALRAADDANLSDDEA